MRKPQQETCSSYDHTIELLDGSSLDLTGRYGAVTLFVNIASHCGFSPQLGSLESLYQQYKEKGFLVIGFPSNDYMGQEPLSDREIDAFCKDKYNITFPIARKGPVSGADKQALYRDLTESSAPKFRGDPGWNFVKFLVSPDGEVVGRYSSVTRPKSPKIKRQIESLIQATAPVRV